MSTFWHWFWLVIEIFLLLTYLTVLFQIFGDLFRDRSTGGLTKALWLLLLFVAPLLGALIYLLVRGKGMAERSAAVAERTKAAADAYIREVAASPAQEIAQAKQLLDAGTITQDEFAGLKAKALATP
ncbi:SHOCT domain-containing protein [Pseudactinotalea terrae]|uniref:SHOCT domain-containing protein n=1 Tax=Pseudactinotalea terrae TaxID=1743262 RepID=UPI0012E1163C|nr:SHOCT domain-containing protein [Pseudactinotalea terrae]